MPTHITARDYGVGLALLLALGVVYGIDQRVSSQQKPVEGVSPEVVITKRSEPAPEPAAKPLRLGVTPPQYDDMGKLLETLGEGYHYRTIALEELTRKDSLDDFDVVFLTCGGVPQAWLGRRVEGESRGMATFAANRPVLAKVFATLRRFVERGGTLYASDWRYQLIEEAFPELVDASKGLTGKDQTVTAEVTDQGLQKQIGSQIQLRFDLAGWYPAAFAGSPVTVYLKGRYTTEAVEGRAEEELEAPLLVKFPVKEGTVIFTSFHNEKQNNELELKLLRYLVFAAVTAKTDAKVAKTMLEGGFSPASKNLLSASAEAPSVTQTYHCTKSAPTQFVLGFLETKGALLRLTVTGPDGKSLEKTGTSTFTIDVPAPAIGDWKYTVTALKVPYPNFPFTLTIGQK